MPQRVKLADEIQKRKEEALVIEGTDGTEFVIDQPDLWSDAKMDAVRAAKTDGDVGRAVLGDDYDEFVRQGGSSLLLMRISREFLGDLGESSASSSS